MTCNIDATHRGNAQGARVSKSKQAQDLHNPNQSEPWVGLIVDLLTALRRSSTEI